MKIEIVAPELRLQYLPDTAGMTACFELGRKIGRSISG
jgi:hypothetical protein